MGYSSRVDYKGSHEYYRGHRFFVQRVQGLPSLVEDERAWKCHVDLELSLASMIAWTTT